MGQTIHFSKMEGLGNDYIYINTALYPIANPAELSVRLSKPHTGIGSDGIILVGKSDIADFSMRIFNADGSEAMMCGNGARCVGKFVYDNGLTDKTDFTLETLSGIKQISLHKEADGTVKSATVGMGKALLSNRKQIATESGDLKGLKIKTSNAEYEATYVCMGNPHAVIFVDDISKIDVAADGKEIEFNPLFPERVNVEFVEVKADGTLRMRVWERGSGITQACGTGACATAVAALITGRANGESRVEMDGGTLRIAVDKKDLGVLMTGAATTVFEGTLNV